MRIPVKKEVKIEDESVSSQYKAAIMVNLYYKVKKISGKMSHLPY